MIDAAVAAAVERRWATARSLVDDGDDPLAAGIVLFATRDYHRAFRAFARARGGRAEWITYERARRIGWDHIAARAMAAGIARDPNDAHFAALTHIAAQDPSPYFRRVVEHPSDASAIARAEAEAPAVVSDAARACDVELLGDEGRRPSPDAVRRVFQHALLSLRDGGTRYCSPEGELLRFSREQRAERLASDLEEARALAARAPRTERPLTAAHVAHFVEHGFVKLAGAVPRALVEEWRSAAQHTLVRSAREGTLRFKAVPHAASRDLSRLDLEDRRTWPAGTAVLPGERRAPIRDAAPTLFGAIVQLLGDDTRMTSCDLSDYFIVRFPDEDARDGEGWHLDDPAPAATLRTLRNGLVVLILFSDVAEDGGATMLSRGSVAEVARALERAGALDLTDKSLSRSIADRLGETVRCAGRAGDVYLTHPLLVHRATANQQSGLRWLSNLMIYVAEPLDPSGSSPVERAIGRALTGSISA